MYATGSVQFCGPRVIVTDSECFLALMKRVRASVVSSVTSKSMYAGV